MKKRAFILWVVFFVIFISFYFDAEIVKGISSIRNPVLDNLFLRIGFLSSEVIIFIILTGLFLQKDKRGWVIPLWVSLAFSAAVSFIMKISIQRQRPYQLDIVPVLQSLEKASHLIWNFSFPSSHAMIAFCVVPILSKKFPKLKYIWITFALLIAFSRIYFGVHFLSDVIAGGVLGYLIGILIVRLEEENKFGEKIYKRIIRKK